MAIPRKLQELLEKGDFDAVEAEWLARAEERPPDLPFFVAAARGLAGQAQSERASFLLEILDGELKNTGAWSLRLGLLEQVGPLAWAEAEGLHGEILWTLERLHGTHASFRELILHVGLDKAPSDIPKTWEKVERFMGLVVFEVGEIVWMEGKGAGRVAEVNMALASFRIDFEGFPRLAVGFKAAPKLLKRIPREHVLHRKIVEPQVLKALAESDPPELLRLVLTSYAAPLTGAEIKRDLLGVVEESRWNTWWTAARKHPQVTAAGSGRQAYAWAASGEHALTQVWESFRKAAPRKKIELLRRDGARDSGLKARMEDELARLAAEAARREPGLALEIWFALEKSGRFPADVPWSSQALLTGAGDVRGALAGIEDRALRERAYAFVAAERSDWPTLYAAAMTREDDSRTLELLANALAKDAHSELDRFLDATLAAPNKSPAAFVWLAERAREDEALRSRSPLRLLQQLLSALAAPEFGPYRSRLLALCESGGTVPRLLPHLAPEQAAQAEEAVGRAAGLEAYQREDLVRALQLRFQALRKNEVQPLYALPPSIEAKRAELHQIASSDIPKNRKAIEEARALGDLRENFEYKSARQRHEYLTARATELNEQLNRSRPIDLTVIDGSEVRVGATLVLSGAGGEAKELSILGPWESNPEAGIISYESELGRSLLGARAGDPVTLSGTEYTIREIRPYAG